MDGRCRHRVWLAVMDNVRSLLAPGFTIGYVTPSGNACEAYPRLAFHLTLVRVRGERRPWR